MLGSFTHPVTMAGGAALVSTPIIIHVINGMRFRRVRWAAMEFLLKAQKRTRRKMILEQLLLLLPQRMRKMMRMKMMRKMMMKRRKMTLRKKL